MLETISTLKFANRAKNIRNEAKVNEDLDQKSLLRKYERELKKLRAELEERSKNVVDKRRLLELDEQVLCLALDTVISCFLSYLPTIPPFLLSFDCLRLPSSFSFFLSFFLSFSPSVVRHDLFISLMLSSPILLSFPFLPVSLLLLCSSVPRHRGGEQRPTRWQPSGL
jgi:hypothetical protein